MAFLEKAKKQDLVLLAEELGQKVSDKMTNIELRNIIIGSKDYEEEFVRDQLSVILEERFERESEEKIARQLAIEEEKIARQHAIQQLRWESELNELRLEIESIRSNVKRTSCAEDRKKTSSNYRISIGRAEEHVRETSPAVLMAEATIPVTTPIKEEKGMDDLRVVYVKVKGEQEMVNAVIDTGAQMPVVRPDVVEGQSINNRGSIQITSAFGEHEMGEVKDSNMELNDFRHGVVPVSKNLVNDMLICSSDYEVLIENSQMIRNPAKLREPSKKEGIISSTDSKSVCSQEVVTDLLPETQSLLNVPNGDLVAVKINGSNVQTNGQGIKESKGEVVLTCEFKKGILYSTRRGCPFVEWEDLCLSWSFFKQTLLKQLLTEGLYDVVNNLGSLAARFILLPVEDSSYLLFTQLLTRDKKSQSLENISMALTVLGNILKMMILLGLTILMFGYSYSQLLLYLYGGTKLSAGIGLTLMRWHCLYVLLLAINGVSEGFKFAVMNHVEIDRYNKSLVLLSVGFLTAAYCLVSVFGSSGFIIANCVNMLFRIVHSQAAKVLIGDHEFDTPALVHHGNLKGDLFVSMGIKKYGG
ncbi:protein RFT1 homolog [Trichonephila clavipes]|nr:protein RFT1 homolog [Trichonephila clavipes]